MKPKYDIEVQFTGQDGNAYNLLGLVRRALKDAGATPEEIALFLSEATSGNYDNLIMVCNSWVIIT